MGRVFQKLGMTSRVGGESNQHEIARGPEEKDSFSLMVPAGWPLDML